MAVLDLAKEAMKDRKDKTKDEKDKKLFSDKDVKAAVGAVRAAQREEAAQRKAQLLLKLPLPRVPPPPKYPPPTNEEGYRLCRRLYAVMQPDAKPDPPCLPISAGSPRNIEITS